MSLSSWRTYQYIVLGPASGLVWTSAWLGEERAFWVRFARGHKIGVDPRQPDSASSDLSNWPSKSLSVLVHPATWPRHDKSLFAAILQDFAMLIFIYFQVPFWCRPGILCGLVSFIYTWCPFINSLYVNICFDLLFLCNSLRCMSSSPYSGSALLLVGAFPPAPSDWPRGCAGCSAVLHYSSVSPPNIGSFSQILYFR